MRKRHSFFWEFMLSLDQGLNVWFGLHPTLRRWGFGFHDETISSVVGKQYLWYHNRWLFIRALYHFLEWLDPNHCRDAIEHDEGY